MKQFVEEWGAEYVKNDDCGSTVASFATFRDALNATGKRVLYSIHTTWTHDHSKGISPAAAGAVANAWRTTNDISNNWAAILNRATTNNQYASLAGPGAWNDPDMLEVGNAGVSDAEGRSHFALWPLMKAPLLIGTDLTAATPATIATLGNEEIIALNQDPLGVQGTLRSQFPSSDDCTDTAAAFPINKTGVQVMGLREDKGARSPADCAQLCCSDAKCTVWQWRRSDGSCWRGVADSRPQNASADWSGAARVAADDSATWQLWAGPLTGNCYGVVVVNTGSSAAHARVDWAAVGAAPDAPLSVRDLWARRDLGTFRGSVAADVPLAHDSRAFKLCPATPGA